MPEFLELLPPDQARSLFLDTLKAKAEPEEVDTVIALGRTTYEPVIADQPLPSFPRSTVDGYAVRAADTYGASESLPAYFTVTGEVPMGAAPGFSLEAAQCALIHTGGMLPESADAVVMVEYTQPVRNTEVEILRSVAFGENVLKVGEDVSPGQEVIPSGAILRPAEIGGLMALGLTRLRVARQPHVAILSSGDEVVPPESEVRPGQVRDVNAYTLSALVQAAGGLPQRYGIIPDRFEALQDTAAQALSDSDLVVITAGSSASERDLTSRIINELGQPGVLVHGVNVRPGKPTILGVCKGKAVIGLPGNPVSALVIASLFVTPVIHALLGCKTKIQSSVNARLALNLPSQTGREDWVAVRLSPISGSSPSVYQADPVFGKSNLIFTLSRADGLVRIPPEATGLSAGEMVEVHLLE